MNVCVCVHRREIGRNPCVISPCNESLKQTLNICVFRVLRRSTVLPLPLCSLYGPAHKQKAKVLFALVLSALLSLVGKHTLSMPSDIKNTLLLSQCFRPLQSLCCIFNRVGVFFLPARPNIVVSNASILHIHSRDVYFTSRRCFFEGMQTDTGE